ncbi:hypothetical protein [Pengzhenrongella frigida]|uniref:C4-dicarboxylate ABC transporter n=1 Tax=Pengzhenrongella frigida TaxID=1259133 RepID=A0A4Q5N363_9MICO|nr:hypothetical protein [Cellulomonas sp. HLT2-17]RYV51693.1 hypothetical protein EUA98_07265 [Cellulomonas sp. HLT2-17]
MEATPPASDAAPPATVDAAAAPAPRANRVRDLHPGWFAAVMGTAIVAVATYQNPGGVAALTRLAHVLGAGLAILAYALGAVLVVAYAARWLRYRDSALADVRHPVLGAMLATVPGGLLVLAVMTSVVGPTVMPAGAVTVLTAVLALAGTALALVFSVAFTITLFVGTLPAPAVNGGWFIPPVVTIIIAMAGAPLLAHVTAPTARLLLVVGYGTYGLGLVLFLLVLGLLYDRLVLHPLPPAPLAPTLWIGLGPVGVAILAPLALARAGQGTFGASAPTVMMIALLAGTALWGFGLWWFTISATLLVRYVRAGALPFHLGWWGFTFPLGAFTVATLSLGQAWQVTAIDVVGVLLYLTLLGFWGTVTARTVAGLRTGRIWQR